MTTDAKTIECEVRTLLTKGQYEKLKDFFSNVGTLKSEQHEETRYFEGEHDLRIQRNASHAKVWLKKGKMHDDSHEEVEIRVAPEKFTDLERLFDALQYKTAIVWLRHRMLFEWDGIDVSLDHTRGYGYVVELELMSDEAGKLETLEKLRGKLAILGLKPTPKPVLHERFSYYRDHWKTLIAEETKTPA